MHHIRRSQLSKENVLSALNQVSVYHHGPAHGRLPKRHIKYMVKPKWNQGAFDDTKYQRAHITCPCHQSAQGKYPILHRRPDKIHQDSHSQIYHGGNNRDEP